MYTTNIDDHKWKFLLEYFETRSERIAFNVNYKSADVSRFKEQYNEEFIGTYSGSKFYENIQSLEFRISARLMAFVKAQNLSYWDHNSLTDPSLFHGKKEIFASIIHERLAYLNISEDEVSNFRALDFNIFTLNNM